MGATVTDHIDRAADEARAFLSARPAPDVTAAVMSQIGSLEPLPAPPRRGVIGRLTALLWAPREIAIRPLYALGVAAAVVMLAWLPWSSQRPAPGVLAVTGPAEPQVFVQFRLDAAASRVQLAGSFTNWEPRYELRQSGPGVWTITVPLSEGVHDYAFVVDGGQWVPDPYAPQIGDGFGGTNSRIALLSPETPQL
jgi:hypothetical protein